MRTLRTNLWVRGILFTVVAALGWLGVSPSYGAALQAMRENNRLAQWAAENPPPSLLGPGLTDTPSPALWQKINARRALAHARRVTLGLPPDPVKEALEADAVWAAAGNLDADQRGASNRDNHLHLGNILPRPLRVASAAIPRTLSALPQAAGSGGDVRPLSAAQMRSYAGRGPLRNPGLAGGPLPWQHSFHDVNACSGNLFKSYTDIQVAPARGAGLVLQRTYNSNDGSVGPFGVGWTHAYDIEMQESANVVSESGDPNADDNPNDVPRTDFFGHKHTYHRDADGLYSPPPYLFDELNSDYTAELVNGPTRVQDDTDVGMDGTVKHYTSILTLADGVTPGGDRACDYIQDRYGNTTTLTYGQSFVQADGSTRKLLTQVTDPIGRSLVFTWTNLGTTAQPAYRITQVQGPLVNGQAVSGVTYTVTYAYYTNPNDPNAANDLYNLQSVTLDTAGLARTTSYTYTGLTGTYYDSNGNPQTGTDNGLLASVTDPLGHTVSYQYAMGSSASGQYEPNFTNSVWVTQITEPGGVDANGNVRALVWNFSNSPQNTALSPYFSQPSNAQAENSVGVVFISTPSATSGITLCSLLVDNQLRLGGFHENASQNFGTTGLFYDAENNLVEQVTTLYFMPDLQWTYGAHANQLTQQHMGFSYNDSATTYYNASQYFQKASDTDADGHVTTYGVGTDTAGNAGDPDPNVGDRGQVLWVEDPGYADSSSPSYHKEYTYTYNQYGQKLSETNLNGVVTQYTYGTVNNPSQGWYDTGNLVQVVQDPGGAGHLNRTTTMHYDAAGHVLQSIDPLGQTSTFTYNTLGQPLTVQTPARGSARAETISYAYDANGRTLGVTDNRGTTAIAYESGCDRVHSVSDPVTGTTVYTYDILGNRQTMTLPGGGTWSYGGANVPNQENNTETGPISDGYYSTFPSPDPDKVAWVPLQVTDDQGRQAVYTYDDSGRLESVLSDEVFNQSGALVSYLTTSYSYFNPYGGVDSRPTYPFVEATSWISSLSTSWTGPVLVNGQAQTVTKVVSQNAYTYDNAGQRLTNAISSQVIGSNGVPETDSNGNAVLTTRTEQYTYDDLSRLSSVNYGDGGTQSYTFDAMGNRLSRQDSASGTTNSTYNAANMLTGTTGTGASTYSSDADGDTLSGGGRTETWDSQNRMTSCVSGSTTSTFTYGADGLRRSMTTGGTTTDYAYDGTGDNGMMVREMQAGTNGSLASAATYFIGPTGPEYRRDDTQTEGDGQGHTFGKTRWYVYDGLGSVLGEVDPLGNLTCANEYDVYGNIRGRTGTATTEQGFIGSLGHLSDASTGLVYMRARYMDPSTGRFVSEDPSGKGNNWFVYASQCPTCREDINGKIDIQIPEIPPTVIPPPPDIQTGPYSFPDDSGGVDELINIATEFGEVGNPASWEAKLANQVLVALEDSGPADATSGECAEFNLDMLVQLAKINQMVGIGVQATETSDETEAEE